MMCRCFNSSVWVFREEAKVLRKMTPSERVVSIYLLVEVQTAR
jgi:hypothetical protein